MVINNIRGKKIHLDRGREELRNLDKLFLKRLVGAQKVTYTLVESRDCCRDAVELSKTRRYGALAISVPVLARLLGFSPPVKLPEIPTFEECRQELPGEPFESIQAHYMQQREEVAGERSRMRMTITAEKLREFITWLEENFTVRFGTLPRYLEGDEVMVGINNLRGRRIHWDQLISGWEEQGSLFLQRLAYARSAIYITCDRDGHGWDAIKLAESAKYGSIRMPVPFLARLLGFSPPVPKLPRIKETKEEWEKIDSQTGLLLQQYHQERFNRSLEERERLQRVISEEEWEELMAWLKKYYKVRFLPETNTD